MTMPAPDGYERFVSGAAYFCFARWTTVRMSGADGKTLLQNLCTNDVRRIDAGEGCETFLTDVKGKLLSHLIVLDAEEDLLLIGAPDQADRLMTHVDRYIIREDVALADISGELIWFAVSRPAVASVSSSSLASLTSTWAHHLRKSNGLEARYVRSAMIWVDSFLVAVAADQASAFESQLAEGGAAPISAEALSALRIESGWPSWGVDFGSDNLPQEAARNDQAISFTKGCYLGQETVARIDALGHVNQQIATVQLDADGAPPVGAQLTADGAAVGRITSSCWSPQVKMPLALAMVRRGHNEVGAQLRCGDFAAKVIATPAVLDGSP